MAVKKIDTFSFQLGMINCFVEMVAVGVKQLALSPPLLPKDYDEVKPYSDKIVKGFELNSFTDESLLVTMLQTEDFTRGKKTILYYKDDKILLKYLSLKKEKETLLKNNKWNEKEDKRISKVFMKLLSYPEKLIKEKLNRTEAKSPFMLVE